MTDKWVLHDFMLGSDQCDVNQIQFSKSAEKYFLMDETNSGWKISFGRSEVDCITCGQLEYQISSFSVIIILEDQKPTPNSVIKQHLSSLLENKTLSDIEFDVDGEKIAAHSLILAAGSPIMAAVFRKPELLNNDENGTSTRTLPVKGTTAVVFRQLLQYMYTGAAPQLKQEGMTAPLFELAAKYAVDLLKEECAGALACQLSVDNAIKTLISAHLHESEHLVQATLVFMSENIKAICCRSEWLMLMKKYPELCFQATQFMFAN